MDGKEKSEESDQLVFVYLPRGVKPIDKFRHNCETTTVEDKLAKKYGPGELKERNSDIGVGTAKIPTGEYDFHIFGPLQRFQHGKFFLLFYHPFSPLTLSFLSFISSSWLFLQYYATSPISTKERCNSR